jgi:hypothetical protein
MDTRHPSDIILKQDSTRAVRDLHGVTDGARSTPQITLEPATASVTVTARSDERAYLRLNNGDLRQLSLLESDDDAGSLLLRDGSASTGNRVTVSLAGARASRPLTVGTADGNPTVRVTTSRDGTGLDVNDRAGDRAVRVETDPVIQAEDVNSRIEVLDQKEVVTGRLDGEFGALVLDRNGGGGDLVFGTLPSADERDVSIHATADANSVFGLGEGIRPLIDLDGPTGTLSLGRLARDRVDTERDNQPGEGADGRLVLLTDGPEPPGTPRSLRALEAGINWPPDQDMDETSKRCGEFVFRAADRQQYESGTITTCGADGLTFQHGDGTPGMRLEDDGSVNTENGVMEGDLPLSDVRIGTSIVEVSTGDVASFQVDVGNLSTVRVQIGDATDSNYELTGTIDGIDGSSTTVEFDTAAAGDTTTDTLSAAGPATVDQSSVTESSLNGSLDLDTYDISVSYMDRVDIATLSVTQLPEPALNPADIEVDVGDQVRFEVFVGGANSLDIRIGDPTGYYGYLATLENVSETPVGLVFDSSTAGDPGPPTLLPATDADLVVKDETSLQNSLRVGDYPVVVTTAEGTTTGRLLVRNLTANQ